ncbi:MAG: glutamate-5-semialdehyde dehydrogenase [Clostridia bacterium]|nr:glutamate-5-semialdehyde dehydrogenase [Clostridia bacterium]
MLTELGKRAKTAAQRLGLASEQEKNEALCCIAAGLRADCAEIMAANAEDLENGRAAGLHDGLLDRLMLNEARIEAIAKGCEQVAELPDPVGRVLERFTGEQGIQIEKISVPLGVIGIIYEARPNVTADAAALCLKSGNACILRGGKEAICSNRAIVRSMRAALENSALPVDSIGLVEDTSRASATALMQLTDYLDLLIPRGGAGLIRSVVENAKVPVVETGVGNCHLFVDAAADMDKAERIIINAKCSRVSVCNALESLLIHKDIAAEFLPRIVEALQKQGVEIVACEKSRTLMPALSAATEQDYATEFLSKKISIKILADMDEALAHIHRYSTHHSDGILTEDKQNAERFLRSVDSAAVYVNASTRFTDGGCFGFGAEIGISTQKMHARGPMGLRALTSYKYTIRGDGQIR